MFLSIWAFLLVAKGIILHEINNGSSSRKKNTINSDLWGAKRKVILFTWLRSYFIAPAMNGFK